MLSTDHPAFNLAACPVGGMVAAMQGRCKSPAPGVHQLSGASVFYQSTANIAENALFVIKAAKPPGMRRK